MTAYSFRCSCHGNFDVDYPMGTAPLHTECSDGRRAQRVYGSARISMYATPTRTGAARVRDVDRTEAQWAVDLPAYKRMRAKGLQPRSTEGAAQVENHVSDQVDINYAPALALAAQHGGGGRDRVVNTIGECGGTL